MRFTTKSIEITEFKAVLIPLLLHGTDKPGTGSDVVVSDVVCYASTTI
jgi:hypothetical protein